MVLEGNKFLQRSVTLKEPQSLHCFPFPTVNSPLHIPVPSPVSITALSQVLLHPLSVSPTPGSLLQGPEQTPLDICSVHPS